VISGVTPVVSETFTSKKAPPFSAAEIEEQLLRILMHKEFAVSDKLKAFLRFVVEETIAGRADTIKAYTIAVQVFGRDDDFDAGKDPIVRIQAGKLRRALERYYLVAGTEDTMVIDIPKGTYVPIFRSQSVIPRTASSECGHSDQTSKFSSDRPALGLVALDNRTGDVNLEAFCRGLADELSTELAMFRQFHIIDCEFPFQQSIPSPNHMAACVNLGVRYLLGGSLHKDHSSCKAIIWLVDTKTGERIWVDQYKQLSLPKNAIRIQEDISRNAATMIAGEYGLVSRIMTDHLDDSVPDSINAQDAILYFYRFNRERTRETWRAACTALDEVLKKNSTRGLQWSLRAQLDIANYVLDGFYGKISLKDVMKYAHKGVALSPENHIVRETLAWAYFQFDDLASCINELEKLLRLNPPSAYQLGVVGWDLCLCGQWQHGIPMLKDAMRTNPHYPSWWHFALFLNYFRKAHYQRAYHEAMRIDLENVFWVPLIRTAVLGLIGKKSSAISTAKKLIQLKPEIVANGRRIIAILVKDTSIMDKIIQGLGHAGLEC
jgi:adenylate cyclase